MLKAIFLDRTIFNFNKMDTITLQAFLVPVIALILVIVFYIILLNKTDNKPAFKQFTFIILILAVLLNFAWEMVQMPLYKNMERGMQSTIFCGVASIADGIMVALLYYSFAFFYKETYWMHKRKGKRIFALMIAGGIGAVVAEVRHVSSESWSYTEAMPLVPVVNVGLSPVLQFMLLPAIIYYLSFRTIKMKPINPKILK